MKQFKKIYYNRDIFNYILEYLNFDEKLYLSKSLKYSVIKNFNFFSKKFQKKTLFDTNCICDNCFCELTSEQSTSLSSVYNNFL